MSLSTYAEARRALDNGETTCVALVSSFLQAIEERNPSINAFVSVDGESALAQAEKADEDFRKGTTGPLSGMVVGVKDVICVKGVETTCASRILTGFQSLYDATAVRRLKDAGAILVGKLNCDEFAMGSSNENSAFGPVRNPVHTDYVPGGSSGGSAAAVAAGLCHAALGSDTGGSIRQPASFCGVVGLKPTYGRVSRLGLVAYASSLDCIGPLARSVDDAALLLQVIAGNDPWDSTSAPVSVAPEEFLKGESVEGLRIGLPMEYFDKRLDAGIRERVDRSVERLEAQGASCKSVSLPHTTYGVATYYILATAEASSNLARYDGIRYGYRAAEEDIRDGLLQTEERLSRLIAEAEEAGEHERLERLVVEKEEAAGLLEGLYCETRTRGFGEEVKRRIMLGTYVLSSGYYEAYYRKAQQVRSLVRNDFDMVFEEVDVVITPAAPTPAFRLGSRLEDPLEMYLSDIYTVTANLAGIPGLVVPVGKHPASPHLPVGVQVLGTHFDERTLFRVGRALERAV